MTPTQLRSALRLHLLTRSLAYGLLTSLPLAACWAASPSATPAPWITLAGIGVAFTAAAPSAFWMLQRLQRQAAATARQSALREPKPRKIRVIDSLSSWQARTVPWPLIEALDLARALEREVVTALIAARAARQPTGPISTRAA